MLKLGVWTPEQFFEAPPKQWLPYLYYRLSRSRVSLRLLRSAEETAFFERLMNHVQLSNGVIRTTFEQRFRDLDELTNSLLSRYFSPRDAINVEDWAASACLASCEWAESLFPLFPELHFSASDLVLFLVEVENKTTRETFIVERDGTPLQYVRPPFVIRMEPPEPRALPLNRWLDRRAQSRWTSAKQVLWPLPENWREPLSDHTFERGNYTLLKLPLVHSRARNLARSDGRFTVKEHSIFEAVKAPCHVIRSMNILNKAYFSQDQLAQGVQSVFASLRPGGIWIVGRTVNENPFVHEVSFLRKMGEDGLELVERIGPGSEVESLALEQFGR